MLNLDQIKTAILQLSPTHQQQIKQWLTTLNEPDLPASDQPDWGTVEQNAYERMQENRTDNIPAEQFLHWLSELEQGKNV